MQVETYEVEEIKNELGVMAADSEAIELIEKLGLRKQQDLVNPLTATRFPYQKMTPLEHKVFSLCFPTVEKIEDFGAGLIPLRVLQVAAHCREFEPKVIESLRVWHTGVAKEDPLLVGHTASYGGEFYLLARWGDALETFDKLCVKARKIWVIKAKTKAKAEMQEWESSLSNLDAYAEELFSTGKIASGPRNWELSQLT